jgi:hypothetical protein
VLDRRVRIYRGSDNGNGQDILVEKTMMAMQKWVTQEIWFVCFALKSTLFHGSTNLDIVTQEISRILLKLESTSFRPGLEPRNFERIQQELGLLHTGLYNQPTTFQIS